MAAATLALYLIHANGGFFVGHGPNRFVPAGSLLPRNLAFTAEGLLLLGGADFVGLRLTASTVATLLHLVGVFLVGWGTWLAAHHLHTGLSGYWEANVVTLSSGGRVRIRLVAPHRNILTPVRYETNASWYDPAHSSANFVVLFPGIPGFPGFTGASAVAARFGQPARTYHVGRYQVLVWHRNLLSDLRSATR